MLPYGISEAGRQLEMTFKCWITVEAEFRRVAGINQLFVWKNSSKNITIMIAEIAHDLQMAGAIR